MTKFASVVLAASLLVAPVAAQAGTAIQSFTGGTTFTGFDSDETVGFTFSTSANLSVTGLGWYSTDGSLAASHQVGIWNTAGALLGQATVAPDAAPGAVGFRYTLVTPFALAAGQQYFVGGRDLTSDGDSYLTSASGLVTAPEITFLGAAVSPVGSGFAFPGSVSANSGGRFGANFTFDAIAAGVPEPATWMLMILGFGAIGGLMRYQIRRSEARFTAKLRRIAAGETV